MYVSVPVSQYRQSTAATPAQGRQGEYDDLMLMTLSQMPEDVLHS